MDNTEQTFAEYIQKGIEKLFLEVAEMISQDDRFNASPLELFKAQTFMLSAWQRYLENDS